MRFLKWREILIQCKVELFIGGQPLVIVQIHLMNSFSLNYSTKLKQLAKLVNINSNFPTTTTIKIFTLRLNNVRLIFAFCAVHLSYYSISGCNPLPNIWFCTWYLCSYYSRYLQFSPAIHSIFYGGEIIYILHDLGTASLLQSSSGVWTSSLMQTLYQSSLQSSPFSSLWK